MKISGRYLSGLVAAIVVIVAIAGVVELVASDDGDSGSRQHRSKASDPLWLEECGACHVAYPARFLPDESWREIMAGLDKHFDSDASLDEETAGKISAYLEQNARRKKMRRNAEGKYPIRITETRWFRREHAEAALRVKDNPKVKSLANCSACHQQAESGSFSHHDIKYPF